MRRTSSARRSRRTDRPTAPRGSTILRDGGEPSFDELTRKTLGWSAHRAADCVHFLRRRRHSGRRWPWGEVPTARSGCSKALSPALGLLGRAPPAFPPSGKTLWAWLAMPGLEGAKRHLDCAGTTALWFHRRGTSGAGLIGRGEGKAGSCPRSPKRLAAN
jgi:hypothetical protein